MLAAHTVSICDDDSRRWLSVHNVLDCLCVCVQRTLYVPNSDCVFLLCSFIHIPFPLFRCAAAAARLLFSPTPSRVLVGSFSFVCFSPCIASYRTIWLHGYVMLPRANVRLRAIWSMFEIVWCVRVCGTPYTVIPNNNKRLRIV